VPDHAHDHRRVVEVFQVNAFPDRVFVAEELAREDVVDHQHARRMLVVALGQKATPQQRNAHGFEIPRTHDVADRPVHRILVRRLRLIVEPEELLVVVLQRHCAPRQRSGFDARCRLDPVLSLAQIRPH
jgi:hypothetical protein